MVTGAAPAASCSGDRRRRTATSRYRARGRELRGPGDAQPRQERVQLDGEAGGGQTAAESSTASPTGGGEDEPMPAIVGSPVQSPRLKGGGGRGGARGLLSRARGRLKWRRRRRPWRRFRASSEAIDREREEEGEGERRREEGKARRLGAYPRARDEAGGGTTRDQDAPRSCF